MGFCAVETVSGVSNLRAKPRGVCTRNSRWCNCIPLDEFFLWFCSHALIRSEIKVLLSYPVAHRLAAPSQLLLDQHKCMDCCTSWIKATKNQLKLDPRTVVSQIWNYSCTSRHPTAELMGLAITEMAPVLSSTRLATILCLAPDGGPWSSARNEEADTS